jgi:glycosyltransferase involved in cell wall biosynthesis/tetratricopeptide (TPR) repeat protein
LLNQIRLLDDSEDISPALVDRIQSLDWSKLHAFYGDLIWALITRNQPIVPILQELPVYKLNVFLEYIAKHNRRYGAVLMNYLQEQELWQTDNIPPEALRVKVLILRSILVFDGLSEDDYEAAFDEYVVNGIPNLMNVYHPDVVENENVKYITTNVDAFLLYMYKAQQCIETDKKKYVRYLRKALESDTQMKKGIEILQKRISQSLNDPQQELEAHKQIIIETIENAINSGDLETATALIDEYESIVGVDAKICSVKSVMLMIGQNWEQAKEVLLKGLNFNEETPDLLFNLGYLYQKQEDYTKSILFYELAKECSNDGRLNNEIEIILQGIRPYSNNKYRNDNENSQRKRVLFVAHIFPPVGGSGVQRTLKYVKYLRNTGWEPIVVTVGRTAYPLKDYSLVTELPGDLKIIRIDEDYSVHDSRIRDLAHIMEEVTSNKELVYNYMADIKVDKSRLKEFCTTPDPYLLWANSVMKELDSLVNINEIDVVYTTSGPYSDHLIGYYLKKRYKLPWVADFRDEWTNNPFAKYDKSSLRYKIEYALERGILQVADKIVVTTPLARENYINGFNLPASKVITITNGYDEDDFTKLNDDNTCKDKFSVFHNGLLYGIRTPITFFKALSEAIKAELIDKDKIEVSFAWTENGKLWIDYCKKLEIEDCVNFVGYLDHKESLQKAMRSDCLLLILGPGKKNKSVYPGKVFEYLRLGKPIMSLSPKGGLVDQLVQEFNAGYNSDFEDINAIKDNLVYFYTKWNEGKLTSNKKLIEVRRFERSNLTNQFACILREVYMKEACAIEKEKILYSL